MPYDKRPCLNCGKPGHISRDCRQPKAVSLDGGGEAAGGATEPRNFNLDGELRMCTTEPCVERPSGRPHHAHVDSDGFELVQRGPRLCQFGDLPVPSPKTSQRAARANRFSALENGHATVSSPVFAPSVVGDLPARLPEVNYGRIEPEAAVMRLGSSVGAASSEDTLQRVMAELDCRRVSSTHVASP